jgi:hypothetical protein
VKIAVVVRILLIAVACLAGTAAHARPGTPDRERAWFCGTPERPRICAEFFNTADQVSFWIEARANGALLSLTREHVGCPQYSASYSYRCLVSFAHGKWVAAGITNTKGPSAIEKLVDPSTLDKFRSQPVGFYLIEVDYETEYCFRFRSVDMDGMISERWSGSACARTPPAPPPPPRPEPPASVRIWFLPGNDGAGQPGNGTPDRVLLKWIGGANSYEQNVEAVLGQEPASGEITQIADGAWNFQAVIRIADGRPGNQYGYRVCSINPTAKVCAAPVYTIGTVPKTLRESGRQTFAQTKALPTSPAASAFESGQTSPNLGTLPVPPRALTPKPPGKACVPPYMHRLAGPSDLTCVLAEARLRSARENEAAWSLWNGSGAYGYTTCIAGYVWREAYAGDKVCVTPEARSQVRRENAESPSHLAPPP